MGKKTKMEFGSRVRMHREKILRWSIREVEAATGISKATLSRVERGGIPDIFTLATLCRWMGFSAEQALIDLGA
jgi:transcriptional regulator with XRE-family HTH domain